MRLLHVIVSPILYENNTDDGQTRIQRDILTLSQQHITPSPIHFDNPNEYEMLMDMMMIMNIITTYIHDHDDSHEFIQELPRVEDKPWGEKYDRPRLVCLVPTLWPKKKFVMEVYE